MLPVFSLQPEVDNSCRQDRLRVCSAKRSLVAAQDMFRKVETPVYTNVYTDSRGVFGVVEYNSHSELRDVIRELKGVEFKNPFCEPVPVDLIDDTDDSKRDARDRDRERDRSPARSPPRRASPRPGTRSLSRSRSRCSPGHCL